MAIHIKNEDVIKKFGKRLKQLREAKGLSQHELARLCDIEHSQVSRIERGVVNATLSTICLLAETLEVEPAELLKF